MIRHYYDISIRTKKYQEITLVDTSSGILITPISRIIDSSGLTVDYINLWNGDFRIISDDSSHDFNTHRDRTGKASETIEFRVRRRIGLEVNELFLRSFRDWFIRRLNRYGWNYTLKYFDELTAVCNYLSRESQKKIDRAAKVIPIPINESDYPKKPINLDIKHPSALIVQNHQIKQKSEALVSFAEIIKSTPGVTYYISRGLPENRNNQNYKRVIEALTALKNVVFVDIDRANKYSYYYSTDFYILRSGLDCTPATILEAGLAGKPVLASAVGGIPEMIIEGKTGWSIPNERAEVWLEKILWLTQNQSKAKEMGSDGYHHVVKNYEIAKFSKTIYDIMSKKS